MVGPLTAVLLAATAPALHVERAADAQLPCRANDALEQAIKVRLPRVRLTRAKATGADLSAQISRGEGGFRFEVRRADGTVAMGRDLYSGCEQLGDTSALILERYLAQISWAGRDVGLVAESPPPPAPALPAPPLVVTDAGTEGAGTPVEPDTAALVSRIGQSPEPSGNEVVSAAGAPVGPPAPPPSSDAGTEVIHLPPQSPPGPTLTALEVSAGAGAWYGPRGVGSSLQRDEGQSLVGAFSLDLGLTLRDRVRLGVLALLGLPVTRAVPPPKLATVQSFDVAAFALLGVCTRTALTFCGHALGGARFTWADTRTGAGTTRLPSTASGLITVPELGLLARLQYVLFHHLLLAADLIGGVPLVRGQLVVKGYDPYLNPPIDLQLQLRAGVRL
ncbi:MAG: hypothetical protein IPJ65_23865 [Archangiaceae bacterium]|nr:hypothetical protein [Archangiaceae bacterium]